MEKVFIQRQILIKQKNSQNYKKRILEENKNDNIKRYINIYEYIENENLNILNFEGTNEEWLKFVFENRQSDKLIHQYDIVKGPVANDNLYQVLVSYENGLYDISETIKRLKAYLLSNQVSFHTVESLECLRYI